MLDRHDSKECSSSALKRMQLCALSTGLGSAHFYPQGTVLGLTGCLLCAHRSPDQRAVLEAVYAIEKLPDAALRDRLSAYLSLTSRQIQVRWCNPPL
jgi:fatty acid/phospholipid biosynthesis enzyme